MFIAGNDISLFELKHLHKVVQEKGVFLYIDSFERIKRNEDNCLFLSGINAISVNEDKVLRTLQ